MPVDNALFKRVMRQWASGVTVITTLSGDKLIGVTASAFNSLSADPPLVLVCLSRKLYTHRVVEEAGVFAVNILSAGQIEIGKRFAGMYPQIYERFAGLVHTIAVTGCPILADTAGWLDCEVRAAYPGGDHTIFVGEVVAANASEHVEPLVYHSHRWGQFAERARSS
ncbi:MAG: flavin reductase family protein [Anaerolineae bacterium]|nr:flavin reductase family protein [Anaerolineae bacterium]